MNAKTPLQHLWEIRVLSSADEREARHDAQQQRSAKIHIISHTPCMAPYLCLWFYNAAAFKDMTSEDMRKIGAFCAPHDERLKTSGKVVCMGSLGMQDQVKTITGGQHARVRDGPYVRTDTHLGALFMVEAESMEEAVAIAKLHPGAHIDPEWLEGAIEVWPIGEWEVDGTFSSTVPPAL